MKHHGIILFASILILFGCKGQDSGTQPQLPSNAAVAQNAVEPPPPPPPAPKPRQDYDVVKMSDGHEMVRVAAGEFLRGSDSGEADEAPAAKIYLDEFLIDRCEVSNAQYDKCVAAGKCEKRDKKDGFNDPEQPAGGLMWSMANDYCLWAGGRLPTEAEWEKAARGTDGRIYPWGSEPPSAGMATFGARTTSKVTANPDGASPYGAINMAGNIAEWVVDWYDPAYYANSPDKNPPGPDFAELHILRGGSYMNNPEHIRSSYRLWESPAYKFPGYGVRCAK